jgi:aminoglycoside/choline kinase family phosphotransferase
VGEDVAERTGIERRVRASVEACLGEPVARLEPLASGLGTRTFLRVALASTPPRSLIARVESEEDPAGRPSGAAPEPPLEPTRAALEAAGLPVPRRLGRAQGIELLEDLGDDSLDVITAGASPARRRALYHEALGLIPRLQALDPGRLPARERRLDRELLAYKGRLFSEWSLPLALGRSAGPVEVKTVEEAFGRIASRLADAPARLAHRDFQSRNLLQHARPGEPARLFAIDLQGAFLAPPEYDAVCLLRDSYVELPDAEVRSLAGWLRPRLPDAPDLDSFEMRFDLITLARKAKDHARFVSLAHTTRGASSVSHLPATTRALAGAARRAAVRDHRLRALADLASALPETPCVP